MFRSMLLYTTCMILVENYTISYHEYHSTDDIYLTKTLKKKNDWIDDGCICFIHTALYPKYGW